MKTIKLQDKIYTNAYGYQKLIDFYYKASKFKNIEISIDLKDLKWLDANMFAFYKAVLYMLHKDNNLKFSMYQNKVHKGNNITLSIEQKFLKKRFNELFSNELFKEINKKTNFLAEFNSNDKDGFMYYLKNQLMRYKLIVPLAEKLKEQLIGNILEIFTNINYHAKTTYPFFVGVQYYPQQSELILSMVDLGVGFLPKIKEVTNGKKKTSQKAIEWALEGKSTKQGAPGGLGLKNIYKYCIENNGRIDIITGDAYWSSLSGIEKHFLDIPFFATTINLFFSYK